MAPGDQLAHYCIVRGDIPFGNQAAQLIHAAGESSQGDLDGEGCFAIALQARDEVHLLDISQELCRLDVPHHLVVESDAPYTGQAMAIGIRPGPRSLIRPLVKDLRLVGR